MKIVNRFYHIGKMLLPYPQYWPKWVHKLRFNRNNKIIFGRAFDFNNPVTFNEKIQWYMINCDDERVTEFTDKISFKDYIKGKLGEGYTAEILEVWERPEDIDLSRLRAPYVIKSNCSGDGLNIKIITEDNFNRAELMAEVSKWFDWRNTFINGSSRAYYKIKPKVFAEEFLQAPDGDLIDYKFYCFDGKPYCAYTSFGGFDYTGNAKFGFYSTSWEPLTIQYGTREMETVAQPKHLSKMLEIAAKLSEGLPFVRVDFYDLPDRVIVGEMTYDSSWGEKKFDPEYFDYELGKQFDISLSR